MPTETNPPSPLDLESKILRALCNHPPTSASPTPNDAATRAIILTKLLAHHWQDPEHRVVFEALTALPGRQASALREQLPAQATRMGFPDVNWDAYFATGPAGAPIETLVTELLAASHEERP
jgi:hypothetical protein